MHNSERQSTSANLKLSTNAFNPFRHNALQKSTGNRHGEYVMVMLAHIISIDQTQPGTTVSNLSIRRDAAEQLILTTTGMRSLV